jgi:hypothetical protein
MRPQGIERKKKPKRDEPKEDYIRAKDCACNKPKRMGNTSPKGNRRIKREKKKKRIQKNRSNWRTRAPKTYYRREAKNPKTGITSPEGVEEERWETRVPKQDRNQRTGEHEPRKESKWESRVPKAV